MSSPAIAKMLTDSGPKRRRSLMRRHSPLPAVEIAESLQNICYEVWTDDPQRVATIVETLNDLSDFTGDEEVRAYADWTAAIGKLIDGNLEGCLEFLDLSEQRFNQIGKPHLAAKTQTSKLYALALLGRYDEAVKCGLSALDIFIAAGDLYSAGKIEHNIGNLYWRRDLYRESEPYLESAHERFTIINDQRQLAMVENCQAFVKTLQNRFREAETIYRRALDRAAALDLKVTEAEIQTGLSNLYLFESRYDLALKFLEDSRKKYEELGMPAQSLNCELEIADIYLELNLLNEAIDHYLRCERNYAELGMQAELARCLKNYAVALFRSGQAETSIQKLAQAQELFEREGNAVAQGSAIAARAAIELELGEFFLAEANVRAALETFRNNETFRLELNAQWLLGEILRVSGRDAESYVELQKALSEATGHSRQVEYLCLTSLGRLTKKRQYFEAAVKIVETSRVSLKSDELRTSFFADRILPYEGLVEICLAENDHLSAFTWHERSRSRALFDGLDKSENKLGLECSEKMREIRDELNWLHSKLNRSVLSGAEERKKIGELRQFTARREKEYAELKRRTFSNGSVIGALDPDFDLYDLQRLLGGSTFVEFASIKGRITAFVVTADTFRAIPDYVYESDLNELIGQYLFHLNTGRIIDRLSPTNRKIALDRANTIGRLLYEKLLYPLGDPLNNEQIVISPAGMMHRLPFGALVNDGRYLIESHTISCTPSASILKKCLTKPAADTEGALLIGVPSVTTPLVPAEIDAVGSFFKRHRTLIGLEATADELKLNITDNGVIHIACHGKYRADNPRFSSLVLDHEELFAHDIEELPLEDRLIVLSSCESGLNDIVAGEEIIGLTRSFFAAGAGAILMSLWRINDKMTTDFMKAFYSHLTAGNAVSSSLRMSQLELLSNGYHPYFWAPFTMSGRP